MTGEERERETETLRQRDRETERQRDRETERQRDRETERQRNGRNSQKEDKRREGERIKELKHIETRKRKGLFFFSFLCVLPVSFTLYLN